MEFPEHPRPLPRSVISMIRTSTNPNKVATAFESTGCTWVLKRSDRDVILAQAAREIDEFIAAYTERFKGAEPPDPFALVEANPDKAAAFFQTFTGVLISAEIRVMAWQLIMGWEINSVQFSYDRGKEASFRIDLDSPPPLPVQTERFESRNLWDYQVFRHIGLLAINGKPILDGYYARPR
jgi:hypothetical protein